MDKRQGFFAALKEEVARGLSPGRSRRPKAAELEAPPSRSAGGVLVTVGEALAPLMEGPDPGMCEGGRGEKKEGWGRWVKGQLSRTPTVPNGGIGPRRSDLRLLLGVMGAPLAPVHVCAAEPLPHLSVKDTPIVRFLSLPSSDIIILVRLVFSVLMFTRRISRIIAFSARKLLIVLVFAENKKKSEEQMLFLKKFFITDSYPTLE